LWSIRHLIHVLDYNLISKISKGSGAHASSPGNLRSYFPATEILQSRRASPSSHLDKVQSTNQEVLASVNFDLSQMDEQSHQKAPTSITLEANPQMYQEVPSSAGTKTSFLFKVRLKLADIYGTPTGTVCDSINRLISSHDDTIPMGSRPTAPAGFPAEHRFNYSRSGYGKMKKELL